MPLFRFTLPSGRNLLAAGFYRGKGGRGIVMVWIGEKPYALSVSR